MAMNVLIVDDSGVMRAMIIKTMRMAELPLGEIHQAANGQEALDVLDRQWVDLVIADINMPVMDGEEMIDCLRRNPETQDLPIIVVSTESSEKRIARLQGKGAHFIHKPFSPEDIRDSVLQVMGLGVQDES